VVLPLNGPISVSTVLITLRLISRSRNGTGDKGLFYDGLVLAASLILWHTKKADSLVGAAEMTRAALNSGKALNRL
jgi:anthranilate phosphoribosyltransferase